MQDTTEVKNVIPALGGGVEMAEHHRTFELATPRSALEIMACPILPDG